MELIFEHQTQEIIFILSLPTKHETSKNIAHSLKKKEEEDTFPLKTNRS